MQSDEKGNYVYVVNGRDEVQRRDVKIGQVTDVGVAILNGLNGDERIVASAGAFLTPGQKVKPEVSRSK